MSVNSRVKEIRQHTGLNQKDFGCKIAVGQGYLSQIEKGEREVTEKILKLICFEFNVNEIWFRTGNGSMIEKLDYEEIIKRFSPLLTKLDSKDWDAILRIANKMVNEKSNI